MASAQPCRLHPDRGARLVDLDAERSNRLARKTQLLGVSSRRNEHLGQVHHADQSRGVLLPPGGKQLAGLGMMPVADVERADQHIGIEYQSHRCSSSASSCCRYPGGYTAALSWLAGDDRIGDEVTRNLTDDTNQVLLSAVVLWEVAIKRSLGKLDAPDGLAATLLGAGAQPLPVTIDHAAAVEKLPWHHRDPFDRLLITQALTEDAAIVTRDEPFSEYGVRTVW